MYDATMGGAASVRHHPLAFDRVVADRRQGEVIEGSLKTKSGVLERRRGHEAIGLIVPHVEMPAGRSIIHTLFIVIIN
jgi:hypothetical protein